MMPQVAIEALKVPDPLVATVTVPVGVVGVVEVSVTVTVQAVATPTSTLLGVQETEVEVVSSRGAVTVMSNVPWLTSWVESPL